jgi:DNA mismatch endonuclease (patch repair protein)
MLQKELWIRGLRYRKNCKTVIGKPDICYLGRKIAIFCESEFWHGFDWETNQNAFHTNHQFWQSKIMNNIERDKKVNDALTQSGWKVVRFWGKDIKRDTKSCADIIERLLKDEKTEKH